MEMTKGIRSHSINSLSLTLRIDHFNTYTGCGEDKFTSKLKDIYGGYLCMYHLGRLIFHLISNLSYNRRVVHINLNFPCIAHFHMELANLMKTTKIVDCNTVTLRLKTCSMDNLALNSHRVHSNICKEVI